MTTTVDEQRRVRLGTEEPKSRFWVVKKPGGRIELIPVPKEAPREKQLTRAEIRAAIRQTRLVFPPWEEIRKETREP
ncbi:MAG: hypothetical protein ACK45B_14575 [Limisphaerales bacterium]